MKINNYPNFSTCTLCTYYIDTCMCCMHDNYNAAEDKIYVNVII